MSPEEYISRSGMPKIPCPVINIPNRKIDIKKAAKMMAGIKEARNIVDKEADGNLIVNVDADNLAAPGPSHRYFPENALEYIFRTGEKCFRTSDITSGMEEVLKELKEPPIMNVTIKEREVYRLFYSGVIYGPTVIRIEKNREKINIVKKKQVKSRIEIEIYKLGIEQFDEIKSVFDEMNFWNMPTGPKSFGADGNIWLLEGNRNNKYHVVYRWSPDNNDYFTILSTMVMKIVGEK